MTGLIVILLLVVLATAVATGARRWSLPAPSLLVVAGLIVGLMPWVPEVRLPPHVISVLVLPPLLFASAGEISVRDLRTVWRPVTALVFGLVLASAVAVGFVARAITPLTAAGAFILGSVLASTDPVAVTALGRRLSLPARVQAMVQAESLFNDATSLVLYKVAVATAVTGSVVTVSGTVEQFLVLAGGGVLIGAVVAALVALIRRRTEDPTLETVIALVTPYASYVIAEQSHTSGVTAVIVSGVVLGSAGHRLGNAPVRLQVHAVYNTLTFLLESVVFALIGLEIPSAVRHLAHDERGWPLWVPVITFTVLAIRLLWIFPLSALIQFRRKEGDGRLSWRVPAVLSWAGTRGVMPLAAALSIPLTTQAGAPLPHRSLILTLTTGTIALTLVFQGFTLAPVVRRSGIALEPEHTAREEARTRRHIAKAALAELRQLGDLDQLAGLGTAAETALKQVRRHLEARIHQTEDARYNDPDARPADAYREIRRTLIAIEAAELQSLYRANRISNATRRRIQRELDLEEASLRARG
ncbi:Na+/H+ antiporter [Streptomyces nodosus]|uniref:Na+/H+ antiporter n=1 Tax=Streptomyces nodosus TaxID=40318 RepID=A0A0B5D8P4_9ACTN|nr:Na+/H+ antiporter [Streptomyces nodosus]AJE39579.1 sodium:proton exchanger [Streptomyces nodosus]MBB4790536.1 CPA1 family monovalent cation:H+ antiporter [Streptomyces nodosus]QEV38164.1 Na+/H+ antiporter [Streptomyces nodosus]